MSASSLVVLSGIEEPSGNGMVVLRVAEAGVSASQFCDEGRPADGGKLVRGRQVIPLSFAYLDREIVTSLRERLHARHFACPSQSLCLPDRSLRIATGAPRGWSEGE